MNRVRNLFEAILDRANLLSAVWKAGRGKRHRAEVLAYAERLDDRLEELASGLRDETFPVGLFQQFLIRDPKERIVTAPCFPERVLHHAVMNVCEPHFERWLIADTFACRRGKGRDAAIDRAAHFARGHGWFLSLDIRRYFDSVSHEVLSAALGRRVKDVRLLRLFARVVGSYRGELGVGLPIGSLTSQHFANFYLDPFDRFVKETLRIRGYVRYMDDMAVWGESRAELRDVLARMTAFLSEHLRLAVKESPVLNRTTHGMDFLGVRLFPTHRLLNRRGRVRFRRRLAHVEHLSASGVIDATECQRRLTALTAYVSGAGVSSWKFRNWVVSGEAGRGQMARTE